ncbi:hypothetical protein L1887_59146 [Cichorium endivia]|nr:hypothetical protein L1887_59146 [Cichorium endivia]
MLPGRPASRETVSKALVTLRLTRWLSLGRRVRNDLSGQVQGNVYLLHDEPVTPGEALEFDKDYLQLLAQSMEHQTKAIREVAEIAWKEFAADPEVGQRLPTRLNIIEARLNSQPWVQATALQPLTAPEFGIRTQQNIAASTLSSESELSESSGKRIAFELSSESELSRKSLSSDSVRNPNSYSTPPGCPAPAAHGSETECPCGVAESPTRGEACAHQAMGAPVVTREAFRNPFGYLMTACRHGGTSDGDSTQSGIDTNRQSNTERDAAPAKAQSEHTFMTPDGNVSQPSYAARMALTRLDTGYGRELSDSGRIIQPGSQVSGIAELSVAARNTQPGFDIGGGIQPSDAARITLTESVICGGRRLSAVAHTTHQGSDTPGGNSKLCGPHNYRLDDAARITLTESVICGGRRLSAVAHTTHQGSDTPGGNSKLCGPHNYRLDDVSRITLTGTVICGGRRLSAVAHNTQQGFDTPGSVICGGRRLSAVAHNTYQGSRIADGSQTDNVASLLLYIDASTNPLPSDYGFNAASVAAQLQHGHVNPLSKE